jgi:hypothetical protein
VDPVKEREFLAGFLALARSEPGALEARAARVIEGDGPAAEKVALLRALRQSGSSESVRWLEHAVRTQPDESGPHAESLPSFALDALARRAVADEASRAALAHLAFEDRCLALQLRRRAAAAFAGACAGSELESLRVLLGREPDDQLVAGALSALEPRSEIPDVRQLLDAFQLEGRAERPAPTEE